MRVINHGIIRHRGRRGDNVSTHPSGTARLNGLWKRDGKFFFMFSVSSMSSVSYSNFVFSAFYGEVCHGLAIVSVFAFVLLL